MILSIFEISARARLRARFYARTAYATQNFRFFAWFGFLIHQIGKYNYFQSSWTNNKVMVVHQSSKSARAPMGQYSVKTYLSCIHHSSSERPSTPNFYCIFGKHTTCRYEFMYRLGKVYIMTSSLRRPK